MDNNDDNLNPMPTEAPVETPTETPAPEAPIDIETTDEPAPADAPVEAPAEEAPAEAPIEESAPIEPSVPVETPAEPTEPVIESNPVASPVIEPAPINMAAPVAPATPKKKSKAGLIIAAIALIVILSGAIIAMLIISNSSTTPAKSGNNSSNNSSNNSNNSSQVVEEEESVLEEGAETKLMNDNIAMITLNAKNNGKPVTSTDTCLNYVSEVLSSKATGNQKLDDLLRYLVFHEEGVFKPIDAKEYTNDEDLTKYYGTNESREAFLESTTVISADTVADRYFALYGEEVTHEDAISNCGGFYYNPKHKVYYYGPLNGCGCLPHGGFLFNLVGYAKKGTTYYADYKVSSVGAEDLASGGQKTLYYSGIVSDTTVKTTQSETFDGLSNISLTGEEWAKIKTYRFVFDKDGDDLHFKEVIEKK